MINVDHLHASRSLREFAAEMRALVRKFILSLAKTREIEKSFDLDLTSTNSVC